MNDFACSSVMCGGSGGTSGSTTASITNGRSAAKASSQAASMSSGRLDAHAVEADHPREVGVADVGDLLRHGFFGSPSIARCSHVT